MNRKNNQSGENLSRLAASANNQTGKIKDVALVGDASEKSLRNITEQLSNAQENLDRIAPAPTVGKTENALAVGGAAFESSLQNAIDERRIERRLSVVSYVPNGDWGALLAITDEILFTSSGDNVRQGNGIEQLDAAANDFLVFLDRLGEGSTIEDNIVALRSYFYQLTMDFDRAQANYLAQFKVEQD